MSRKRISREEAAARLRIVRRYTGDKFGSERGYDLKKPLSPGRLRAVSRYFNLIVELTAGPHRVIVPPKGGKREAFSYTGQKGFPKFARAIVPVIDAEAKYSFSLDKSRPRGSRFTVTNVRTREKSWHIPAEVFLDNNLELYDPDADQDPQFFTDIIEEYAEHGEVYMIEAGDHHMWGDAGTPETVGEKLAQLFQNYDSRKFDAGDRNSHFIGNWFRGVSVYSPDQLMGYLDRKMAAAVSREVKTGLAPFEHLRMLQSGDVGRFYKGELVRIIPKTPGQDFRCRQCKRRFPTAGQLAAHKKLTGHT